MNFEISEIIETPDLKIKRLTYERSNERKLDINRLMKNDLERFNTFGCTKRQMEFYFTRLLWQHFPGHQPISYNIHGKPTLKNGFISISHSQNVVAIAHSDNSPIGLDIEHFNPKIWRVRDKFLSPKEKNRFDLTEKETITTLWSIKEAVYKLMGIPGLSFKNAIEITKIGDLNNVRVKSLNHQQNLTFQRIIFDDFILTYCTDSQIQ